MSLLYKDYLTHTDDNAILYYLNQNCTNDPSPQKVDCDLSESFARKEKYWQVHWCVNHLKVGEIFCKIFPRASFLWFERFIALDLYLSCIGGIFLLSEEGIDPCNLKSSSTIFSENIQCNFKISLCGFIRNQIFHNPESQKWKRRSRVWNIALKTAIMVLIEQWTYQDWVN